jgi:hypothetical protein
MSPNAAASIEREYDERVISLRRPGGSALAVAVGLVLASPVLARAQTTERAREVLVVRATPELAAEADAVAARIVERRAAEGVDVTRAPSPPREEAPETSPIVEATRSADEAFGTLALAEAERAIGAALTAAEHDGVRTRSEILDALLLAAMIRAAAADERGADEAVRAALAVDATLVIDPERYPPTLAARVDAARPSVARCTLVLATDPTDAEATLDGEPVASGAEAGCGLHWITVSRRGYATTSRRIVLAPGDAESVSIALAIDPATALAQAGAPGTPIDPLVERGAAALGRGLVVLDLARDDAHALVATLGTRSARWSSPVTPDTIADALLAPATRGGDDTVAIGVGIGIGAAVALAIAIGVAVAVAPGPTGWIGNGEVVRP